MDGVDEVDASAALTEFGVPTQERYFEDYRPGAVYEFGSVTMDEARIIEFAREFDPQPIHVDPDAAARGMYGGIIASGFHTTAVMMRMLADHYLSRVASLGSPGIDELRWLLPVRPGDTLRLRITILDARRSASRPDRGVLRTRAEMINQNDQTVLRLVATNFMLVRAPH